LGVLFLFALATTPAIAQDRSRLGFDFGTTRYGAIAHDNSSPRNELSPHQPLMATLRFTSHLGRVGIGLSLGRSWLDFGSTDGTGVTLVQEKEATIWEFSPELRVNVIHGAAGGRLDFHGGVIMDKWHIKDFEDRSRLGFIVGATVAANLGNGWNVDLRGDLATTGSPFNADEAGGGISLDRVRRTRLTTGVSYQL
jgi:opacity protein-like surface antigen